MFSQANHIRTLYLQKVLCHGILSSPQTLTLKRRDSVVSLGGGRLVMDDFGNAMSHGSMWVTSSSLMRDFTQPTQDSPILSAYDNG